MLHDNQTGIIQMKLPVLSSETLPHIRVSVRVVRLSLHKLNTPKTEKQITMGFGGVLYHFLPEYVLKMCLSQKTLKLVLENVFNRKTVKYCDILSLLYLMLPLHWTTFSPRPYHVLKIPERGEDGVKMKQFRISKFPLRPYYVSATSLLRPHHVLTTSFTFPLRPQYALTKFIPFPLRPCYVLTKTKQFITRANYVSSTF